MYEYSKYQLLYIIICSNIRAIYSTIYCAIIYTAYNNILCNSIIYIIWFPLNLYCFISSQVRCEQLQISHFFLPLHLMLLIFVIQVMWTAFSLVPHELQLILNGSLLPAEGPDCSANLPSSLWNFSRHFSSEVSAKHGGPW